jgi:hypothetical protein
MKTISFNINHYYSKNWKRKMYAVSVLEETNVNAKESDKLVYSVKSLFEQRNIRYKKDAKEFMNILRKEFNN